MVLVITNLFAQQKSEPWQILFNGKNLDGWEIVGNTGIVKVIDSAITCNMIKETNVHTFVATEKKYGDFILEMDINTDTSYNSGVILRAFDAPANCDTCNVSLYGYQVKLDPSITRKWSGGIFYDYGKTWRWLYPLENDERAQNAYKVGLWNHFRMEVIGSSIKIWVNGIPVTNLINNDFTEGYIALKIHSLKQDDPGKEKLKGRFKNIRIITEDVGKYAKSMDIPAKEVR
jgi:hypothetical protein